MDPLAPEQLHIQFTKAAKEAAADIKSFSQLMDDPWSKMALERARESRERNTEDITNWLVTEHGNWLNVKKKDENQAVDVDVPDKVMPTAAEESKEETKAILDKFKGSHPGANVSMDDSSTIVRVRIAERCMMPY